MIELFEHDIEEKTRHSSKGNQLKWNNGKYWYKADYAGYEGLAEYMVSRLLCFSSLSSNEYVLYDTEKIKYRNQYYTGCKSKNFLPVHSNSGYHNWQLVTLERLFHNIYSESLYKRIYHFQDHKERLKYIVDQVECITELSDFGKYMSKLMTIDAFFLNEDRHMHNIAVLWNGTDKYDYCPIFDQGAALLSDTVMDYPVEQDVIELMPKVRAKTFCGSFEEQLDIAEDLYGETLHFTFKEAEIKDLLKKDDIYPENIKERVYTILLQQRRKYQWLFR